MPRLEDWMLNIYTDGNKILIGEIHNDEKQRFLDGTTIRTSTILELNLERNYAQTRNTKYELGVINGWYLDWCKRNNVELKSF
jgi:hypothetical protein